MIGGNSMEKAQPRTEGPELLSGCNEYASRHDILAAIPSRSVVDTLVARYFDAMDMTPGIFHVFRYSDQNMRALT